ncbi:DUF2642 domain-containing protein [Ureibacillus sp. FSL K6-0165]|jgi:hypothetical protein|uniref:DUF2642 domain-containing protein n=1 Tax=Ureibacillus sp. FSL K6-0165 TaxID=2954606 RepID=UPI0030F5A2AE
MHHLNNEVVFIEIMGGKIFNGSLIDSSDEIFVIHVNNQFVYLPTDHIYTLERDIDNENNIQSPSELPQFITKVNQDLTLLNILSMAKGLHVELMVTRNEALHGVITSVMDDYFVFQSPIYNTMYIPNKHLKWIIPHIKNDLPYGISETEFLSLSKIKLPTLKKQFADQIAELKGQLVILNLGKDFSHIGKINHVEGRLIEMKDGKSNTIYCNLSHIQIVNPV